MSRFTEIDLSQLPPPDVVTALDFEAALAQVKAVLIERMPALAEVLTLESEPLTKLAEVVAYLMVLGRAQINDGGRAVMLATATGADLDNLAALLGVERLTVTPADPDAIPPTPAVLETDGALRARTQLALEGYTSAGSVGAYEFHARSADGRVADASVISPAPGTVLVTVLSSEGDGTPDAALLEVVEGALSAESVRPLCDQVTVAAPDLLEYMVTAELEIGVGPDTSMVLGTAVAAVERYVASVHLLGATVARSGLMAALHQAGVIRVDLLAPATDIPATAIQAPHCISISVTQAVS